jgi:hypothetical protein
MEPAAKDVVDKAAEATKSGIDAASTKAQDTLDFVAKKAALDEAAPMVTDVPAPGGKPSPKV